MRRAIAVVAGVAVLVLVAGCGSSPSPKASAGPTRTVDPNGPEVSPAGDIPDNQVFVAYSPPGEGYSVKVPEGWGRTVKGPVTTFTDKLNRIAMRTLSARRAASVAQARRSEVPKLARSVPGFKAAKVSTVSRNAGKAIRITYLARSPVDEVTGASHTEAVERYRFAHGSKDVVLTLSGPKGADNVDPWKIVTDSLRFTR